MYPMVPCSTVLQRLQMEVISQVFSALWYFEDELGCVFVSQFKCCGVNNFTDWYNIKAWPEQKRVPLECCRVEKCNVEDHPDDWYQYVSHTYLLIHRL